MDTRQRILLQAIELFMRYGIRNVSMDDIAKELGISKKTIYQLFKDKAEIVIAVSSMQHEEERKLLNEYAETSADALAEVWNVMQYLTKTLKEVSPLLIFELQKYYPEAWQIHLNFTDDFHLNNITTNLKKGILEGMYRCDFDVEIIGRMRLAMIDTLFNSRWFPHNRFGLKETHDEMFRFFIHGLLTEKGKQRLRELMDNG